MRSDFFYRGHHLPAAREVLRRINACDDFLTPATAESPRAAGDAVQQIVSECFQECLGEWCAEYSPSFARRAMADLAFKDKQGFYCIVDVKTHRANLSFSMPALVSVERLARFYEDDSNIFSILLVRYAVSGNRLTVSDVLFSPIEFIDWSCLTIGALGWGQLQIANSNNVLLNERYSRKKWMLQLCEQVLQFYPREIAKINQREEKFSQIKSAWVEKPDVWAE